MMDRLNARARLGLAVGKTNFMFGNSAAKVCPELRVQKWNGGPNFGPLLPRPWRRMMVWVCAFEAGMMKGGGYTPVIFLVCVVAFGAVSPKPWELSPGGSVLPVL
jgi:hypothetical protein